MLRQLWMSGILAAFLVFGIKIGVGLGAQFNHPGVSKRGKWFFLVGSIIGYLVLFTGMHFLVTGLNLLDYLDRIVQILKYGMIVHFALAAGLLFWGIRLLIRPMEDLRDFPLKAGLLLVMPCPVCASVILLNLSLAFSLFPLAPVATTAVLFGCFLSFILATLLVTTLFRRRISSMESFLGISMVLVSLYFIFTILVAPIYPEIKAAHVMAVSNAPTGQMEIMPLVILAATILGLGCAGFFHSYFQKADQQ